MRLSVLIVFLSLQPALSQTDSTWFFETPKVHFPDRPTVSLSCGIAQYSLNGMNQSFAKPGLVEVRLGFSQSEVVDRVADIVKRDFHSIGFTTISTGIKGQSSSGEINSKLERITVAWDKGFGYGLGSASINSYHSFGLQWSQLSIDGGVLSAQDSALLSPFDVTFRFGTKTEGGIQFFVVPLLSIDAGYERSIIMPKHLFWKWAGSMILEGIAHGMLDRFIDTISDSSPEVVPVVHFVLKNALSYGVYELRRKRMNWPFDSDSPLVNDAYKVGLTFVF